MNVHGNLYRQKVETTYINGWMSRVWCIHLLEYCLDLKRNVEQIHTRIETNLKILILEKKKRHKMLLCSKILLIQKCISICLGLKLIVNTCEVLTREKWLQNLSVNCRKGCTIQSIHTNHETIR